MAASTTGSSISSSSAADVIATNIVTANSSSTSGSVTSIGTTTVPGGPNNPFPQCHQDEGPYRPFCQPTNGSTVYAGQTYYVTWDADFFPINSTITLELTYSNDSNAQLNAYESPKIPNAYGFVTLTMDSAWLQGATRNNLTMSLVSVGQNANTKANISLGPTISLMQKPTNPFASPEPTPSSNRLGLKIGLPLGLLIFTGIICGLFFGKRKQLIKGLGDRMRRNQGYGISKSTRQRLGKNGMSKYDEGEADPWGTRRSQLSQGIELQQRSLGHARDDSLGSLADNPRFEDRFGTPGNAFRDEISRQKTGR